MEPPDRPDGAAVLSDAELDDAVLAALSPRGLGERVRLRLARGYTVLQVWERLPPDTRARLGEDDEAAVRRGVERVRARLAGLAGAGRVAHGRSKLTVSLNTKGPRDVLVDVYRVARVGRPC